MRVHIRAGRNAKVAVSLLWLIYAYNSVIQILWFVHLLIRQVSKRITVGSSERSTISGGSNSSTCSPKALISWR